MTAVVGLGGPTHLFTCSFLPFYRSYLHGTEQFLRSLTSQEIHHFYGTRTFVILLTKARQQSIFWARWLYFTPCNTLSLIRFNVILSLTPRSSQWLLYLLNDTFKNSVHTAKKIQHFTVTNFNWLTLFKETIAVNSENHTKHINANSIVIDCCSMWDI
jgi:hypothetical protein